MYVLVTLLVGAVGAVVALTEKRSANAGYLLRAQCYGLLVLDFNVYLRTYPSWTDGCETVVFRRFWRFDLTRRISITLHQVCHYEDLNLLRACTTSQASRRLLGENV